MPVPQLYDSFGRSHTYLRISLTDACNLRCTYCMPEEKTRVTPSAKLMQAQEIEGIARIFAELGINKIRLTGGEPLLRKDARDIIQRLSTLPVELAISTNAILADEFIPVFLESGIRSVNVSLDTLNPDEFKAITKRGDFERIMRNIQLMLQAGLNLKLNMVVMRGINEHMLNKFVAWTKDTQLDIRFIEFMPFAGNAWKRDSVYSYTEMLDLIAQSFYYSKLEDPQHSTSKTYQAAGHTGTFGFITTVTEPFCGDCNRLRLTADGKLKNCLFSSGETNLLAAYRAGEDIKPLILENLQGKKKERGGQFDLDSRKNRSMVQIGG
jgi:cyclic pyranopterin phosphate synthase